MKLENRVLLLESELRDREIEISLLKETAEAVSSELEMGRVFQLVVERARNLIMAETVLLPIIDENGSQYTHRAGCGKNAVEIVGQTLPLDRGVFGWVWQHKRAWWHGVLGELDAAERAKWEQEASNIVLVPLIGKRQYLGGITCINKIGGGDFTQRDLDLLSLFANHVSFAIDNATLFNLLNRAKGEAETYQHELQTLNIELERRVAQRTSALADAVKELEYLALHDLLTDLPNRSLVEDRLQQGILISQREKKQLSFITIDLNQFKEINDKHGHEIGDHLLKQIAMRIRHILRKSDTAGRLGDDEFTIVLPSTDGAGAEKVAKKLLKVFESPYKMADNTISVACCIGIAMFPQHGQDVATLYRCAEVAMYASKKSKTGYSMYRPEDGNIAVQNNSR